MINTVIAEILEQNNLEISHLKHIKNANNAHIFYLDDDYVLRITDRNVENQIRYLERIKDLNPVQKILYHGNSISQPDIHYFICNKIPGLDYIDAIQNMSKLLNIELGNRVSLFLDSLHSKKGKYYDIGHYIPIIPRFSGSWLEGHKQYWDFIHSNLEQIDIEDDNKFIINRAFEYFDLHSEGMVHQSGPVLLHNDLHPKNIIVNNSILSGVIDWECSQYGEPDFEFCHFIHWCLYPPKPEIDLKPFLGSMLDKSQICSKVEHFAERQTVYQLEHEMMQIIWSKGKAQTERILKMRDWIDGKVHMLLKELGK